MFHRHFEDHLCHGRHNGFGRGPFGWVGRGGGFWHHARAGCSTGELKLVILALVPEKPRHGYEIIKELSERVGGDYSPEPGRRLPDPHHARGDGLRLHEPGRAGPQALFRHARGRKTARRLEASGRRHLRPLRSSVRTLWAAADWARSSAP